MLISEAPIGTKVVLGTCRDEDLLWRKVTDDLDFISEVSICRLEFDSEEPDSESRARRNYGNNFFPHSNILQFLNSTHDGKDWFVKQHENDMPPLICMNGGFLSTFTKQEFECLVDRTITVAVPLGSRKQFGRTYQMSCKVCLPSMSELGLPIVDDILAKEGSLIPELQRLVREIPHERIMTRTGIKDAGHIVVCYTNNGQWEDMPAGSRGSIHPMIRLRGDVVISDEVNSDGFRYVRTNDDDGFMEDFLNILKI